MSAAETGRLDCGRTLEELGDYLDRGRRPADPEIESCPECVTALEGLQRLRSLSVDLLATEADRIGPPPTGWLERIMAVVQDELRAGRDIPLHHPDPRVRMSITEGAVRALLRSTGDEVDGLVVTRTAITGDVETPGAPVGVELTVSAEWGRPLQDASAELRSAVLAALERHTDLAVASVDITIGDLRFDDTRRDLG